MSGVFVNDVFQGTGEVVTTYEKRPDRLVCITKAGNFEGGFLQEEEAVRTVYEADAEPAPARGYVQSARRALNWFSRGLIPF